MIVALLDGSHRRNGNTSQLLGLLKSELSKTAEVETIVLRDHDIELCRGCFACLDGGECVQDDDMKGLFDILARSDVIVLGTPTYYGGVTARLKCFIDRSLPHYDRQTLAGKIGSWVVTYEGDAGTLTEHSIIEYFRLNGMLIAPGALCLTGAEPNIQKYDKAVEAVKALAGRIAKLESRLG
jgi:multimeric flavodoxin WrbA